MCYAKKRRGGQDTTPPVSSMVYLFGKKIVLEHEKLLKEDTSPSSTFKSPTIVVLYASLIFIRPTSCSSCRSSSIFASSASSACSSDDVLLSFDRCFGRTWTTNGTTFRRQTWPSKTSVAHRDNRPPIASSSRCLAVVLDPPANCGFYLRRRRKRSRHRLG